MKMGSDLNGEESKVGASDEVNRALSEDFIRRLREDGKASDEDGRTLIPAVVNLASLREQLKHDKAAFIKLFLYEQEGIDGDIPAFHIYGFNEMTKDDELPLCIAWPRGHAKTTLAKLSAVYMFVYDKFRFLAYISNTSPVASNATRDIAEMIRMPLFQKIYGKVTFLEAQESKGNYTFLINRVSDGFKKRIIIRSLGAGQQVRGLNIDNQRPDLAIVDDLESAEEGEENKLGYKGLRKWFFGTFRKALDQRKYRLIQIGNYVAAKSILGDNIKSPYWRSIRLAAITKEGKPLWPGLWSLYKLRMDLLEYIANGELATWLSEMMNMPLNSMSEILNANSVRVCEELDPGDEDIDLVCITVDPAIASNLRYADSVVIFVHAYHRGVWKAAEIKRYTGIGVFETYDRIMEMVFKWRVKTVGIEIEAYQAALQQVCEYQAAAAGLSDFIDFVPLKTYKKSKASRIIAFAGMVSSGNYEIPLSCMSLVSGLLSYDIHATGDQDDDEPDCAAYILQMIQKYSHLMLKLTRPKVEAEVNLMIGA